MKVDYQKEIENKIRQAKKQKDAPQTVYYSQARQLCACASWDKFKGSWAFTDWLKTNTDAIKECEAEFKRFAYLD